MKDPPFFMGKSTISMVIFNSYVSHYQRVPQKGSVKLRQDCRVLGDAGPFFLDRAPSRGPVLSSAVSCVIYESHHPLVN